LFFLSNRVVITRHDIFVGKYYICDSLFKLNFMAFSTNKISPNPSLCGMLDFDNVNLDFFKK